MSSRWALRLTRSRRTRETRCIVALSSSERRVSASWGANTAYSADSPAVEPASPLIEMRCGEGYRTGKLVRRGRGAVLPEVLRLFPLQRQIVLQRAPSPTVPGRRSRSPRPAATYEEDPPGHPGPVTIRARAWLMAWVRSERPRSFRLTSRSGIAGPSKPERKQPFCAPEAVEDRAAGVQRPRGACGAELFADVHANERRRAPTGIHPLAVAEFNVGRIDLLHFLPLPAGLALDGADDVPVAIISLSSNGKSGL